MTLFSNLWKQKFEMVRTGLEQKVKERKLAYMIYEGVVYRR